MAGQSDLTLTSSLDLSGANRDLANFAKNAPTVKLKFDSSPLGNFSKNASEFQKSLAASQSRVIAFSLTAANLYGIVRALQAITKATINVEKQLTDVNVILGLSQKQLQGFSRDLFKIANETGSSFDIVAKGAVELSRQGLSATETLKRLKDALTLTRLSGLSVEDSISAITTAINGFNDAALDSTTIINKLANVDSLFAVSAKDLADALARVGSTAKDTGVKFDELLGLVTAARQITGREGSVIGNSLKTIFQRIERPEVLENLRELGVLVEDYSGKNLSAIQILQNLGKTYDTLSQSQKNQVVQLSAGVFQANQFRAILGDLAKQNSITARATDAASNATDQASRRQAELNKTLSANINETLNNLTALASKVGTLTLEPVFRKITGGINELAGSLTKTGDEAGIGLGQSLGEGVLKGIGNYLSGPGLALGGILLSKLFLNFASFTAKSLSQIVEVGTGRYQTENAIQNLLKQNAGLEQQIAGINASNLSLKQKELQVQEAINAALIKSLTFSNKQSSVNAAVLSNIRSANAPLLGVFQRNRLLQRDEEVLSLHPRRRAAVGLVPSIQESIGAIKAGYNPGAIKELNIPKLGKVVYNSAETVKNFPGFSQPAIIPPQSSKAGINYNKSFIQAHGFSPYKAEGYIPNYARNLDIFRGIGVGPETSAGGKFITQNGPKTIDELRSRFSEPHFTSDFNPHDVSTPEKLLKYITYSRVSGTRPGITPFSFSKNDALAFAKQFPSSTTGFLLKSQISSDHIIKTLPQLRELYKNQSSSKGIFSLNEELGGNLSISPGLIRSFAEKSNIFDSRDLRMLKQYQSEEKELSLIGDKIFNIQDLQKVTNRGLIPNFMPQISKAQAAQLLKSKQFQSLTYQKGSGELGIYNAAQYRVRRDKLVGAQAPEGFDNWTEFDEATGSLVLHSLKQGEKEAKFRRFSLGGIKKIRAQGENYDVFNKGLIPNYASLRLSPLRNMVVGKNTSNQFIIESSKGSFATFRKRENELDLGNIESKQRGEGFAIFNKLSELAKKRNVPIYSQEIIAQEANMAGLDEKQRLYALFPQLRWRDKSKQFKGQYVSRTSGQSYDFETLKELENVIQQNLLVPSKQDSLRDTLTYFNAGLVPNFNSLSSAIAREHSAGLSLSQIRVGSSPKIRSSGNPLGLGVYNTKDEPLGLNQGIQRYANMGLDPKKAGIPNYATKDLFGSTFGVSKTGQVGLSDLKQLNIDINKYRDLIRQGLFNQTDINKATKSLSQTYKLNDESLKKVTRSFTALYAPVTAQQKRLQIRQQQLSKLDPALAPNIGFPLTNTQGSIQGQLFGGLGGGQLEFQNIIRQVQQPRITAAAFPTLGPGREQFDYENALKRFARDEERTRQRPFASLNKLSQSSYLSGSRQDLASNIRDLRGSSRGLPEELRQQFQTQLRDFSRQANQQFRSQSFFNETSKLGFGSIFGSVLPERFSKFKQLQSEAKKTGQLSVFDQNARQRLQGKALNASFVLPLAGGVLEQGIGSQFGESTTGRGLARLAGGGTNIASFTATGFGIAGPAGALGGLGLGLLSELPSIFKAFTDTLPDLERNLEKLKKTTQQSSVSIGSFIEASDRLEEIYSGRVSGVTNFQVNRLKNQQAVGLAGIPGAENRNRLRELFSSNNLQGARELGANINQINEQRQRGTELEKFFGEDLKQFNKSEQNRRTPEQRLQDLRRRLADGERRSREGFDIEGIINKARPEIFQDFNSELNDPKRIQSIQQTSSRFISGLFGLTSTSPNQKGEFTDLFSALTKRQLYTPRNSISAIKDVVPQITSVENFSDALRDIGQQANIDSTGLEKYITIIFKSLSKSIQEEIVKTLNPDALRQSVKDSEKFIGTQTRSNKTLSEFTNKLIRGQDAFEKFGRTLDSDAISRASNQTSLLRGGEITQRTSNQIRLSSLGSNPFIANRLNLEEEQLKTTNDLKEALNKLTTDSKQNIFDVLANTRKTITENLNKNLTEQKGTVTPEDYKKAADRLDSISKFLDVGPEMVKIKALLRNPNELDKESAGQIKKFFQNRISLLEQFKQVGPQTPLQLDIIAEEAGTNLSGFFGTQQGKEAFGRAGLTDVRGELNEVGKLFTDPQNSPKELSDILKERNVEYEVFFKAFQEFLDIVNKNTSNTERLQGDIKTRRNLTQTQFQQNQRLLPLEFRFNDQIANQVRKQNIGAAQGDEFGNIGKIDLQAALFTPLEYNTNTFWRDMATNVQDFSADFKSSFQQGFKEAITGAKSFGDAMRGVGLSIASNILGRASDLSVNVLFGALTKQLGFSGANTINRVNGGYIPKYAKGGYVNMGSGLKDDVPAFLSGGEFVLNQKATRRIGKGNLDALNFGAAKQPSEFIKSPIDAFSGAIKSDSTSVSGNSAIIKLANTFELDKKGRNGKFNTSSLLSSFALTDENNPQNRLKFSRESYTRERKQFDKQVKKAGKKFEQQQITALIGAYVSAGINVAGSLGSNSGTTYGEGLNGAPGGTTYNPYLNQSFAPGYGSSAFSSPSFTYRKNGGYIPRYSGGGFFGGDSSSDKYRALIQGGEYVASPSTVQKYGVNYFNNLNKSYAAGGYVQNYSNDSSEMFNRLVSVNEEIRDLLNRTQDFSKNPNNNSTNGTSSGPTNHISISVTVDSNGKVNSDKTKVDTESKDKNDTNDRDRAILLSQAIKSEVIKVINDQSRNGGILAEKFQSRR